jgi:ABC-type sugar transport system permease subunit
MRTDKRIFRMSIKRRRAIAGLVFISPFVIGFLLFCLYPLVQSIVFTFNQLRVTSNGYELEFIRWENYRRALLVDTAFMPTFTGTIAQTLTELPLILVFSFLAAALLNQKFRGRAMARMIFFLPVIITSGVLTRLEEVDYATGLVDQTLQEMRQMGTLGIAARQFMMAMRLPQDLLNYVAFAVDRIPQIVSASGIPILIFLAGLQSIPQSYYEASDIEGATSWESFWKITFPLITPLLPTNIVYVMIDSFTAPTNGVIRLVEANMWSGAGFGGSLAMAWMYFAAVALVLALSLKLVSKHVFYQQ